MHFDKKFFMQAVNHAIFLYDTFPKKISFSIDSRTLVAGDIFVAIKGEKLNGHEFIIQALQKGASGIICTQEGKKYIEQFKPQEKLKEKCIVIVPDVVDALISLAALWRSQFTYPVIAITGSVGKTSTKELLMHILKSNNDNYLASFGNQNSFIGIAINMLKMSNEYKGAIFEIGIDKSGQMRQKAALVQPTISVITCVGHSHMEGLGAISDIAAEKRDIFSSFKEHNIGIINGDQLMLSAIGYRHPIIKFGTKTVNQIQARKIGTDFCCINFILKIYKQKFAISIDTLHQGAIYNILAAVSAAYVLSVPTQVIIKAIKNLPVVKRRFETYLLNKIRVIDDCYNASPESMKAALLALQKIKTKGQKVAILGDMLELGVEASFWHRQIGRFLHKVSSLDQLILVGKHVECIKETAPFRLEIKVVPTWQDAIETLKNICVEKNDEGSVFLVKGSRAVELDHVVDHLVKNYREKVIV